jgi:MerR family transcriptional regulator, light-induced transcriptional regulator
MQTDKSSVDGIDEFSPEVLDVHARQRSRAHAGEELPPGEQQRVAGLVRTIEGEIVPRLLMARLAGSAARSAGRSGGAAAVDSTDVAELAQLLLDQGPLEAAVFVDSVHRRGTPLNRICLELLAPAAKHLSTLWEQEKCSFSDLSFALAGLRSLLREVSAAGRRAHPPASPE